MKSWDFGYFLVEKYLIGNIPWHAFSWHTACPSLKIWLILSANASCEGGFFGCNPSLGFLFASSRWWELASCYMALKWPPGAACVSCCPSWQSVAEWGWSSSVACREQALPCCSWLSALNTRCRPQLWQPCLQKALQAVEVSWFLHDNVVILLRENSLWEPTLNYLLLQCLLARDGL